MCVAVFILLEVHSNMISVALLFSSTTLVGCLCLQTIVGQGIDNHLLALRQVAAQFHLQTPALFTDVTYQMANHFTLSTSQVVTRLSCSRVDRSSGQFFLTCC
jgi:Choline/Carnitine o-acyltransferase